jgi:hypothetical protein
VWNDAIDACARLVYENLASQAKALWKTGSIEHSDVVTNALAELLPRIRALALVRAIGEKKERP